MGTPEQEIAKLQAKIDEIKEEQERIASLSPDKALAESLHNLQCTWNHTDGCGWFYEVSDTYPGGTWNGYAHKRYLDSAKKVMALLPEFTHGQIISVAEAFKGI